MPKMKTNKSAAKRFKRTGTGKFRRASANRRHLLTRKTKKSKRSARGTTSVAAGDSKRLQRLLPYL